MTVTAEHENIAQQLCERGLRTTRARLLILDHLSDRTDHPTADAILRGLRHQGHELGPATLYQNLSRLSDAGLLLRLTGPDGLMHFDATVEPHPHLSCFQCGRIVDAEVQSDLLDNLSPHDPLSGEPLDDWLLHDVQLELKGLCPDCQRDADPESQPT